MFNISNLLSRSFQPYVLPEEQPTFSPLNQPWQSRLTMTICLAMESYPNLRHLCLAIPQMSMELSRYLVNVVQVSPQVRQELSEVLLGRVSLQQQILMILDVHNLKPVRYVYMFREVFVSFDMKIDGYREYDEGERKMRERV